MPKRRRTIILIIAALLLLPLSFYSGRLLERYAPLILTAQDRPALPATAPYGSLPLSQADRVAGLSAIWEQARYNYPFWQKLPDLDWDQAYRSFIPRVLAAEDDLAYYRLLEEFIALLQDGHTSLQLPPALTEQLGGPALRILPVGGQMVIAGASEPLVQAGLVRGAVLTAVDGRPVADLVTEVSRRMAASTPQDRLERTARQLLVGPTGSQVTLSVTLPDGSSRSVTVTREAAAAGTPALPLEVADQGDGIYLVTIRTFGSADVVKLFREAFPSFRGVKGLIFDVRENGGGNTSNGDAIISRMIRLPIRPGPWRTRERMPTLTAWGKGEQWYYGPTPWVWPSGLFGQYSGPVLVLTSPRTYSAAEDFVVRLQASGRAQVVGQPTGGSTGQPLLFPLPGGGTGRILTKWDRRPDGSEFVGVGLQPDIPVEPTAADLAAGRDAVLAKALETLRQ